jgi:hypothetical protein
MRRRLVIIDWNAMREKKLKSLGDDASEGV